MKTQKTFLVASIVYFLLIVNCFSQSIGIGATSFTPDPSAILDVSSTTQGQLVPRMTTIQRNAITSSATGLLIFNTDCLNFQYYDGTQWINVNTNPVNAISTPGIITGLTSVCANQTGVAYSISAVSGATSYIWSVPTGYTITAGQGTTNITVSVGNTAGNICVVSNSNCGTSSPSCITISITPNVGNLSFTLGSTSTRCQGAGTVTYSATASNTTGITYSLDAASLSGGNTIIAGTGAVTYASGWSGTTVITASAAGCYGPVIATHTVTIIPFPDIIAIPSSQTICSGNNTSIALNSNVTGATFAWTVTQNGVAGANNGSGSSIAQTLTNSGTTTGTATYTITPTANACSGTSTNVVITVKPTLTDVEFQTLIQSYTSNEYDHVNNALASLWDDRSNPAAKAFQSTDQTLWAILVMTTPVQVKQIRVADNRASGYNYTGNVHIKVSHNGTDWTTIQDITCTGNTYNPPYYVWWPSVSTYYTPANTTYWEYLYIGCSDNTRGAWGNISELIMNVLPGCN